MRAGTAAPVLGHLFAWLWTGLAIHALVLYYAAMSASQRLAEDKQTGALELILCTPTTERTLARGLWLAYGRKMLFPALLAGAGPRLFHLDMLVMATLDPPGRLVPRGHTRRDLLERPARPAPQGPSPGLAVRFHAAHRVADSRATDVGLADARLGGPVVGIADEASRVRPYGFARASCLSHPFCCSAWRATWPINSILTRLPERRFLPMMMWLAFAIGCGHCLVLSVWAATRLRHRLRSVAMSRYQPLPAWRWRLPSLAHRAAYCPRHRWFAVAVPLLVMMLLRLSELARASRPGGPSKPR